MDQSSRQYSNYTTAKPVSKGEFFEDEYDDIWPGRLPTSSRRYRSDVRTQIGHTRADVQSGLAQSRYPSQSGRKGSIPPRRTATQAAMPTSQGARRRAGTTEDVLPRKSTNLPALRGRSRPRFHWLVYVGAAMLAMVVGWTLLSGLISWWQVTQDDWHYGRPRTFQTDFVVGHNDSSENPSHFIIMNLRRHIEIIEFPGGDSTKARVFVGPVLIGQDQDLAPATADFKDVNNDGKPDMVVNVQGSHFIFLNEDGTFRPLRPGENVHL